MLKRVVVDGPSMVPTLLPGERLLVFTWAYRIPGLRAPRRGDLVMVQHPSQPFRVVKRVAGVPGDTVEDGHGAPRTLAESQFWVRGDHAAASTDSAAWGPVPASAIRGRVVWRYRPWGRVPRGPGPGT